MRLLPWLIIVASASCTSDQTRRLEANDGLVGKTILDEPVSTDSAPAHVFEMVLDTAIYRIGENPKNESEEFGDIRGGMLLPSGDAIVADFLKDRLVHVGPRGQTVRVVARAGEGPGEIREPTVVLPLSDTSMELWDNGVRRVTTYAFRNGAWARLSSRRLENYAYAVCRAGTVLVGFEYDVIAGRPLQIIDESGRRRRGIGLPFAPGSNQLNHALAQGPILCDPARDQVIVATPRGDLIAWSTSGEFRWRRKLADVFPTEITQQGGLIRFQYAPPPANKGTSPVVMVPINDTTALVQLLVVVRSMDGAKATFAVTGADSRFFDLRTGAPRGRQEGIPRIIALQGNHALVTGTEPEPWVEVRPSRVQVVSHGRAPW